MAESSIRSGWRRYRSVPIIYRIGAAFVLGSIVGLLFGEQAAVLQPLGDLFVRLLQMIVVPIIVFTLIMGVRQLSPSTLGKVGGQVVAIYAITSMVAVFIGLTIANLINPGSGLQLTTAEADIEEAPNFLDVILGIVPENPIEAIRGILKGKGNPDIGATEAVRQARNEDNAAMERKWREYYSE